MRKQLLLLACLALGVLAGCNNDKGTPEGPYKLPAGDPSSPGQSASGSQNTVSRTENGKFFGIASGTVVYDDGSTLQFEQYGLHYDLHTTVPEAWFIYTGDALYMLDPEEETYEVSQETDGSHAYGNTYLTDYMLTSEFESYLQALPLIVQSTVTIAGQTCVKYSGDGAAFAGYQGIMFLDDDKQAVSFQTTTTASFTVPSGYTQE